jgi:hypothetical protein
MLCAFNLRLHDNLLNTEVKVSIFNSVECNVELKLEAAFIIEIFSDSQHF